jgi:hypothetical protein
MLRDIPGIWVDAPEKVLKGRQLSNIRPLCQYSLTGGFYDRGV